MAKIEIKARENGPYKIFGVATYVDESGQELTTTGVAIALCRCGQSANKPFCDRSHRKIDFKAPLMYLQLDTKEDIVKKP
jgi:CDGSH-type Zn-finger protein